MSQHSSVFKGLKFWSFHFTTLYVVIRRRRDIQQLFPFDKHLLRSKKAYQTRFEDNLVTTFVDVDKYYRKFLSQGLIFRHYFTNSSVQLNQLSLSLSLTHTHSLSLSVSLSHTLSLSLSLSVWLSLSLTLNSFRSSAVTVHSQYIGNFSSGNFKHIRKDCLFV